jgi:tetratricopeptide (TPR) repeat protein
VLFKNNDPQSSLHEYREAGQYATLGAPEFEVIGCDYFLLEDYPSADKWLTKSLQAGNKTALGLYLLGRAKYNERQFTDSISILTQSLALDPKNIKAETSLGHAYQEVGQIEAAERAFRAAIELEDRSATSDAEPYLALGRFLVDTNKPRDALPFLEKVKQLVPNQADSYRQLGRAYLALNEPDAARSELETAVKLAPGNAPDHFLLAQAYRKLEDDKKAIAEENRYRQLGGNHSSPDDPLSEARSLVQAGQLAAAEQMIRDYLTPRKNSAEAHYLLGFILFKKQDARGSLAEYTEGAKYRQPTAAELQIVASDYVLLHDFADADRWFTKVVEWDPGNWPALYYLGRTKYNENRFDEAEKIFRQCLASQPKSVKAEDNLGLSLEGLGRTDEAISAYKNAISFEADAGQPDSGPYLDLGTLLVSGNRDKEAVPYLRQALTIAPQDVRAHRELGKAFLHLDQLEQAESELEKAVQLSPESAPSHFVLAQVYRKRGLADKARAEMDRYTALAGTHSSDDSH